MAAPRQARASSFEEIKPLVELCKAGKLFEVTDWITEGYPVSPPLHCGKGGRKKTPLTYAIDQGFHSLVKVLLDAGAELEDDGYSRPIYRALEKRRFDIVQLFVDHGFDPKSIEMREVFSTWDLDAIRYFIDRGANVVSEMPLAEALCFKIRPALTAFKEYKDREPSFPEQANVALRHHCKAGNLKWISLLLWAGADPCAKGESEPHCGSDSDCEGLSALAFAALYDHYEVFDLKKLRIDPGSPVAHEVVRYCSGGDGSPIIERLLKQGLDPNDRVNGGCSAIQTFLTHVDWSARFRYYRWEEKSNGFDTAEGREHLRLIHLLARHGGRWVPEESGEINAARRALVTMTPDYTLEFVWIMGKYKACSKQVITSLVHTPKIKRHTAKCSERLAELLEIWPAEPETL
ncbi:ankyrin repeat domain-containing protein [Aeoliella sp. ICT_H6.2]|uniref:Ankyrin repeat domain-containing protein n=1 Tax=Aeoliella straminimaris TaxID=2954799 RepID=A0A9X2JHV6_9BACT|nr:ankyrin repeat domain-containing protein [Aeoliella straminimaris]MCO6043304.1 ankyrin repeat domain-containing protein [Aeoliella straminimaris]